MNFLEYPFYACQYGDWQAVAIVNGGSNIVFILLAGLINVLMLLGAGLGSLMVYKYGVAVEAVEVSAIDYFQEYTHSH